MLYVLCNVYNISGDHTAPWQRGDQLGPGAGPPLSVRPGQQNSQGKTVDNHDSQRYKSPDLGGKRDDRKSEQIRLNKSVLYQAKSVCTKVPLKAVKTRLSTRFWLKASFVLLTFLYRLVINLFHRVFFLWQTLCKSNPYIVE